MGWLILEHNLISSDTNKLFETYEPKRQLFNNIHENGIWI